MTGPQKPESTKEQDKKDDTARNTPGARQAVDGAQQAPGVPAVKTAPTKPAEDKGGSGVGGAEEIEDDHPDPENAPVDNKLEPAKPQGKQLEAAPTKEKLKKNSRIKLTEENARRLSPAELRAVAHDRGYKDIPYGGREAVVQKFLAAQEKDETLEEQKEGEEGEEKSKK